MDGDDCMSIDDLAEKDQRILNRLLLLSVGATPEDATKGATEYSRRRRLTKIARLEAELEAMKAEQRELRLRLERWEMGLPPKPPAQTTKIICLADAIRRRRKSR